jgi:hypothetical protein
MQKSVLSSWNWQKSGGIAIFAFKLDFYGDAS